MAHHQNKKSPTAETNAKHSDATHCRVGHSTILLKRQGTIVWWKIREQKFIYHLCVTRRDCDGFSVFILKELGSSDSSGPNSAPYGNFWVISGALMKFVRICSWPVSKVLLINCAVQMKMCLISHQKFVRQVCIFSQYSHKLTTKLQAQTSSGSKKKEPRYLCLSAAKASHSQKMWAEVSSLTPHFLHSGLSSSRNKWRCLRRALCPVRRPVTTLDWFLLEDRNLILVPGQGPEISSRACLRVLPRSRQLTHCWLISQRLSLFLMSLLETPMAGSGPRNPRAEPPLASPSVISLPHTPACPGNQ